MRTTVMSSALVALWGLGGCAPDGGGGSSGDALADAAVADAAVETLDGLEALTVTMSPTYALVVGLPRTFRAEGHFADAAPRDVSAAVTWTSSDPAVLGFDDPAAPGRAMVYRAPTADLTVTATLEGVEGALTIPLPCDYPEGDPRLDIGATLLPMSWDDARLPDGTRGLFSLRDDYCGGEAPSVYAILLVSNWCPACHGYLRRVAEVAEPLRAAGGAFVVVSIEDDDFAPADTDEAVATLERYTGAAPVYIVGDADVANSFAGSGAVTGFPSMIVVRSRDMQVIADSHSGAFRLDLAEVAADPDAGWEEPPPVEIDSRCVEGQDEASEPNNTPETPAVIGPGGFDGGVCDAYPDFFQVDIEGPWRLSLEFEDALGNLDLYAWDPRDNAPLRVGGRVIASAGEGDSEVIEHAGPTLVRVGGFLYESAPYHLTLEAL